MSDEPIKWLLSTEASPLLTCLGSWADQLPAHRVCDMTVLAAASPERLWAVTPDQARASLHEPGSTRVSLVIWRMTGEQVHETLLNHPQVVGILDPQTPKETAYSLLSFALRVGNVQAENRAARMLEEVLEIGRALAAEKDLDALLGLILTHARSLTGADGSSIYTRDSNGKLYFRLWQNASTAATANAQKTLVGEYSIAGYVARTGEVLNVEDAYAIPAKAPYSFNPASDSAINYRTRSLLTLPLSNKNAEVVGVLQLINRKDRPDVILKNEAQVAQHVLAFNMVDQQIALALAGQAGVALENSLLYADIERLFEGFIKASVQAIEARDPTTAGHSFRVADFTERLAVAVDRSDTPALRDTRISRPQLREIRYAALLHDFGKVGVREDILVKAKKLYPQQLELLKQRFKYARLSSLWQAQRKLLDQLEQGGLTSKELQVQRKQLEKEVAQEHRQLDEYLHLILRANEPTIIHAQAPAELEKLSAYTYLDGEAAAPLLLPFEFADLTLAKGSLSPEERLEIESHVTHTFEFLSLIPWTRDLADLPTIAYAHHEKLDGSGYPRGLAAAQIPLPSRMMTIADIYDALTAPDRPYKQAMGEERALAMLEEEAHSGKLDADLLRVFIEAQAYRAVPRSA